MNVTIQNKKAYFHLSSHTKGFQSRECKSKNHFGLRNRQPRKLAKTAEKVTFISMSTRG